MTGAEREVLRLARELGASVAECERLRVEDAYPHDAWRSAWNLRVALQSKLIGAATALRPSTEAGGEHGE